MALYNIAGLNVEMSPKFEHLKQYAEKYLCKNNNVKADFFIDLPDCFLEEKQKENPHLSLSDCEYIWSGAMFASKLLQNNGFVLHSSAVEYEGKAYLFSAKSGTGKSTHTSFWQEVFGYDKTLIINDDKPAIRYIDGKFYTLGTPFSGKSSLNSDVSFPIKALCFIYRSEKNEIRRLSASEAIPLVFEQTLRPKNANSAQNLLGLLDGFFRLVPIYSLGVTYSKDSALFAYEAINGVKSAE